MTGSTIDADLSARCPNILRAQMCRPTRYVPKETVILGETQETVIVRALSLARAIERMVMAVVVVFLSYAILQTSTDLPRAAIPSRVSVPALDPSNPLRLPCHKIGVSL